MKEFLPLLYLIVVDTSRVYYNEVYGGCVEINGVYHEKEILYDELVRARQLAFDYGNNKLFFTYYVTPGDIYAQSAILDITSRQIKHVEGPMLRDSVDFAHAIDQKSHKVYIGGHSGLYEYDYNTNQATHITSERRWDEIWNVFFKDILYFSQYSSDLYKFEDGKPYRLPHFEDTGVASFVIDNNDDIFFNNRSGTYCYKNGTKTIILITTDFTTTLTIDKNGNVYTWSDDGIYQVIKKNAKIEKIVSLEYILDIAFDNDDNIIYSDGTKLIRLKRSKNTLNNDAIADIKTMLNNVKDQQERLEKKIDTLASVVESLPENYNSLKAQIGQLEAELFNEHQYDRIFNHFLISLQNHTLNLDVTY